MLAMIGRFGMNGGHYQAVEYCGEAVSALSMNERMTLSNMSAELGAQVGPDRARRRNARLAVAGRRARHRARRPGTATKTRRACATTSTPRRWRRRSRCRTARPMRATWTTSSPRAIADRLHRRLHRRQARRPARRRARAGRLPHRRAACACWWRRPACATARPPNAKASCAALHEAGAELLPSACGAVRRLRRQPCPKAAR